MTSTWFQDTGCIASTIVAVATLAVTVVGYARFDPEPIAPAPSPCPPPSTSPRFSAPFPGFSIPPPPRPSFSSSSSSDKLQNAGLVVSTVLAVASLAIAIAEFAKNGGSTMVVSPSPSFGYSSTRSPTLRSPTLSPSSSYPPPSPSPPSPSLSPTASPSAALPHTPQPSPSSSPTPLFSTSDSTFNVPTSAPSAYVTTPPPLLTLPPSIFPTLTPVQYVRPPSTESPTFVVPPSEVTASPQTSITQTSISATSASLIGTPIAPWATLAPSVPLETGSPTPMAPPIGYDHGPGCEPPINHGCQPLVPTPTPFVYEFEPNPAPTSPVVQPTSTPPGAPISAAYPQPTFAPGQTPAPRQPLALGQTHAPGATQMPTSRSRGGQFTYVPTASPTPDETLPSGTEEITPTPLPARATIAPTTPRYKPIEKPILTPSPPSTSGDSVINYKRSDEGFDWFALGFLLASILFSVISVLLWRINKQHPRSGVQENEYDQA